MRRVVPGFLRRLSRRRGSRRDHAVLAAALVLASAAPAAADRPDTPSSMSLYHFEPSDVVDTYGSPGGDFLLHFTRSGMNAVIPTDADGSGVPDYVEQVAVLYDDVLAFYRDELGFRAPLGDATLSGDNGGDGRFDVYFLDFGGGSDGSFRSDACGLDGARPGQCVGYMVQENDFAGYGYPSIDYASRVLSSHEFFHAVQAAYDADQGSVIAEGTAVWATETFDPSLDDFEGFVGGFLDHTDRPIDHGLSGPVDPFSYGAALFFEFLDERFDRSIIRQLWEACDTQPWLPALDQILMSDYASSFAGAFTELAGWDLFTASYADPSQSYANGAMYPPVMTKLRPAAFLERLAAPRLLRVGAVLERLARLAGAGGGGADRRRHGGPRDRDGCPSRQRDHAR